MWLCGSDIFVQLRFVFSVAPIFFSDLDPLVLKAYTPAYVQSHIDLLKRQKKFTTKLVLEKPKLPPKKSDGDPAIGQPGVPKGGSAQDLIKGQSDPDPAPPADPVLQPVTTQGLGILNQLRSGKQEVVLVPLFHLNTKSKGHTEGMPLDTL